MQECVSKGNHIDSYIGQNQLDLKKSSAELILNDMVFDF